MNTFIDLFNGVIKFDSTEIVVIIDNENVPWFQAKRIAAALGYKNTNNTINIHVADENRTTYEEIYQYSLYRHNIQDHTVFINESGMYQLALSSTLPTAQEFKLWITNSVLPSIRKYGKYTIEKNNEADIINKKLSKYKKRVKILENNQKKEHYPKGGYVYVIKPAHIEDLYKIGKTEDINKRLQTYNTAVPDKVILVARIKTNFPTAVETCMRGVLHNYRYTNKKEYYKIGAKKLIKFANVCKDIIETDSKRTMKRATPIDVDTDDDDEEEIYGIMAVTKESEKEIHGGNIQHNEIDYMLLYQTNKCAYINLCNLDRLIN